MWNHKPNYRWIENDDKPNNELYDFQRQSLYEMYAVRIQAVSFKGAVNPSDLQTRTSQDSKN